MPPKKRIPKTYPTKSTLVLEGVAKTKLQKHIEEEVDYHLKKSESTKEPFGMWSMMVRKMEPVVLATVLKHTEHNRAKAARILGINRNSLYNKMRIYNMIKICQPRKTKRR